MNESIHIYFPTPESAARMLDLYGTYGRLSVEELAAYWTNYDPESAAMYEAEGDQFGWEEISINHHSSFAFNFGMTPEEYTDWLIRKTDEESQS